MTVSSDLEDSFVNSSQLKIEYSCQCCDLDSRNSFSDFQFGKLLLQAFKDGSECTNYNRYHRYPNFPQRDPLISARRPDLMIINKKKKKREFAKLSTLLSRWTTE